MKILIVGPVQSDKYFGGVATFTESLADGFNKIGYNVEVLTDYTVKEETFYGSKISAAFKTPKRRNPLILKTLANIIKKKNPDLLITSLEYGLALFFLNNFPGVKIHFLHAFPAKTMAGYFKTIGLNLSMKLIAKKANYMISNSSLTSVVNKEIYGIKSNCIIPIGLGYEFINTVDKELSDKKNLTTFKNKGQILYAGRIASEKNIDIILKSIEHLHEITTENFKLLVIGEGPELAYLKKKYSKKEVPITFLGSLSQKEIVKHYLNSEIFISMNPHEPFGITYLEALYTNCKIVCPSSGGHLDFSHVFNSHFNLTNPYNYKSISEQLSKALTSPIPEFNPEILTFTYEKVALKILDYVEEQKA